MSHKLTEELNRPRANWCQLHVRKIEKGLSKRVFNIVTSEKSFEPESRISPKYGSELEDLPTKVRHQRSGFFIEFSCVHTIPLEAQRTVTVAGYVNICLLEIFRKFDEKHPKMVCAIFCFIMSSHSFAWRNSRP